MGNRRPNNLPTSNMAAESTKMTMIARIPKTATIMRYPIPLPSWVSRQDLARSLPAGCLTRAPPRGNGERPGRGWSPCRRRRALPYLSHGECHIPRKPALAHGGIDVDKKQSPTVETVAKGVGHV